MSSSSAPSFSGYHSQSHSEMQLDSSSVGSLSSASLGDPLTGPASESTQTSTVVVPEVTDQYFEGATPTQADVAAAASSLHLTEDACEIVNLLAAVEPPGSIDGDHIEPSFQQMEQHQMLEVEVVEGAQFQAASDSTAIAAAAATVQALEAQQTQLFGAYDADVAASLSFAPCDVAATSAAAAAAVDLENESASSRIERSNSCSQAETCGLLAAARTSALASSSQSIGASASAAAAAGGSVSQENLAICLDGGGHGEILAARELPFAATSSPIACPGRLAAAAVAAEPNIPLGEHLSSASCSPPRSALNLADHFQRPDSHTPPTLQATTTSRAAAAPPTQSSTSSSSRFFSSKLNTGSLWSLLSVGSSTSMNAINEISTISADCAQIEDNSNNQQQEVYSSTASSGAASKQFRELTTRSANFFNQFKTKSSSGPVGAHHPQQVAPPPPPPPAAAAMLSASLSFDNSPRHRRQAAVDAAAPAGPKYRFSVKYIGSAMLHKNFTLPMLEWIAKDVRRQTSGRVAGSGAFGQRQFTIPVREIMLEIQTSPSLRLTAISCKDGHAIFVHPMHCVSKYAQLQHDSSSFAYIIRDSKEAPSFCHVFRAKSASRVHEIFSAIREVTTRNQLHTAGLGAHAHHASLLKPSASNLSTSASVTNASMSACGHPNGTATITTTTTTNANKLQKSASTDGHWRSLLGPVAAAAPMAATSNDSIPVGPKSPPAQVGPEQQQQEQFENSYQFEVMFVKRVKLSCRRVPPSFVDDALETLKTFEVPKTTQIKGGVTKRIISASVDERQEYDEHCQSPTPDSAAAGSKFQPESSSSFQEEQRRSSSVSLRQQPTSSAASGSACSPSRTSPQQQQQRGSESKSCQQSPVKLAAHAQDFQFSNDFSPYNTITSSDLNERIAAIPVVSGSVSLDDETRQKLARQVRETIMATAANITSAGKVDTVAPQRTTAAATTSEPDKSPSRRISAASSSDSKRQAESSVTNNFDLFRRASARQVVKNRTMLLVIGKDELAAISIDKHQMLFNKTFSSIVHCLQGIKNKDHFGLICRDSGKINPQTESYAGFVFKCQSDKVVREIMGALKQVIYSSQHNYHGYYSPYNPLNSFSQQASGIQSAFNANASKQQVATASRAAGPGQAASSPAKSSRTIKANAQGAPDSTSSPTNEAQQQVSLAAKRGFANPIELDEAQARAQKSSPKLSARAPPTAPAGSGGGGGSMNAAFATAAAANLHVAQPAKNHIKSMFCDDCPLYWYHRLCCDVESLPAEASKAIILRRIDSSLGEREQDEVFTKFSEFKIDTIDEHNEIFMSILRHLSELKQLRHSQSQAHLSALAKNASLIRKQSSDVINSSGGVQRQSSLASSLRNTISSATCTTTTPTTCSSAITNSAGESAAATGSAIRGHQRSGSSGGSLAFVQEMNQSGQDASSLVLAIDLKRAKNSISVSIENMLKLRRPSLSSRDDSGQEQAQMRLGAADKALSRSSSFKGNPAARTSYAYASGSQLSPPPPPLTGDCGGDEETTPLKRSQSTSDYPRANVSSFTTRLPAASWRDSLTRTLNNADDLANPLVSFFKRRGSLIGDQDQQSGAGGATQGDSKRTSTESLPHTVAAGGSTLSGQHSPSRYHQRGPASGHSTPSNLLSGSFWKKSIFDKIQKTSPSQQQPPERGVEQQQVPSGQEDNDEPRRARRRTREELRALWKKAILEQITLLKMDKQNQKLMQISDQGQKQREQQQPQQQEPSETSNSVQRAKLNYRDVPYGNEAGQAWAQLLKQDPTRKVQFAEVARHVRVGVPKPCRGEAWMFLMNQYQLRHGTSFQPAESEFRGDANQTYRSLLSQLSTQQHEIFVDIGRTFPSHPYYSRYLSIGQLSLFNLLKAYSLLDPEVGYCQGLSFVAGILLLHVDSEDEAFELMRHLMFNFGLRKQYLPSMDALHLQLYQMTRLLRDHEFVIFDHFDRHDISPSLYAAPWFLTLFASQFPLGFVARLFDLIYLVGIEAIFRVSLTLLAYHRARLLECTSLELTMDFMRAELVKIDDSSLVKIFDQALGLDLRNKLIEYEIEYSFYCADDKARASSTNPLNHHLHHYTGSQSSSWARHNNQHHSSANSSSSTVNQDLRRGDAKVQEPTQQHENDRDAKGSPGVDPSSTAESATIGLTSEVADATATVIIQHLLANNHLRSLRSNYSY